MNDTRPVSAEQLMSTPVVGVTAEHSLAAAWAAMPAVAREAVVLGPRPGWCEHGDRD